MRADINLEPMKRVLEKDDAILTTYSSNGLMVSRPIKFDEVESQSLNFYTTNGSGIFKDVQLNNNVKLTFYDRTTQEVTAVSGKAELMPENRGQKYRDNRILIPLESDKKIAQVKISYFDKLNTMDKKSSEVYDYVLSAND